VEFFQIYINFNRFRVDQHLETILASLRKKTDGVLIWKLAHLA